MASTRHALRRASNALASASRASFSSAVKKSVKTPISSTNDAPKLLRHHLYDELYAPKTGYFTAEADPRIPVGSMRDVIDDTSSRSRAIDEARRAIHHLSTDAGSPALTSLVAAAEHTEAAYSAD